MSLQDELNVLAKHIASFKKPVKVSDEQWSKLASNSVVALMAGGESTRYAAVLEGKKVHKNAHQLPNGDTMIEMAIRAYRDAGIKRFVALVCHNAHSIENRLGDGSSMGVEILYSHDPNPPAGKGGAIRNAIENGSIPLGSHLFVVNPDDVILNFPGSFVRHVGEAYLEGEGRGMLATAVLAPGQRYAGTGVMVADNVVIDTQMYPIIPIPIHAGITIIAPKVLPRFLELFSLKNKCDYEQALFSLLASERKLWSVVLDKGELIAVNDLKSYKQLIERI
jgi:NDP-sugar pyrophosphorylase family protein